MDNVVSINRVKVLGAYIDAQNGELIPEDAYFYAGVLLSVVLPQFTFFVYGGPLPLLAFAVIVLAGSIYGLARYRSPYRFPSCVDRGTEARVPPRVSRKRVA